ncbi:MAG: RAMP superfamily CRISPR-associated protein [Desulfotomaculales bacterium]
MTWRCFRVTYELLSPLHIGHHRVGNVQRTRRYIPARNLWGAVTERLTRAGFGVAPGDYRATGAWVKEHCAFSYWFVSDERGLLAPRHGEGGLRYGSLKEFKFDSEYLAAYVSTALDPAATSAETGSLHEVEVIAERNRKTGERTRVGGWVFLDEQASQQFGDLDRWGHWLGELQVGGERRYGFGRLRLSEWEIADKLLNARVVQEGDRPGVEVPEGEPLLAHAPALEIAAQGAIEPLVGRETDGDSSCFGKKLTPAVLCWVPGAVVEKETAARIDAFGLWVADPVARSGF